MHFKSRQPWGRRALGAMLALSAFAFCGAVAGAEPAADRARLERDLDEARTRLDAAARDVADITRKLHRDEPGDRVRVAHAGPRGAMLGINIGGEQDRLDGVEIMGVSPSGPSAAAGLRKGDVIVGIDGKPLRKTTDRTAGRQLVDHLRDVQPGQVVKVDYLRDGKKVTASVTTVAAEPPVARILRERLVLPEGMNLPPDFEEFLGVGGRGFRSLELVSVTPKLGQYFGTDKGLLVVRAPASGGSKLEEGDVILTIGGRTPDSPRHAFRILGSYQPGEKVNVEVLRQRKRLTLELDVPAADAAGPSRPPVPPARGPTPPDARGGSVSS